MGEDERADQEFENLLEFLKRSRGFDFTGYKRASLRRRVDKRMRQVGVEEYAAFIDYLEVHPDEFVQLFNTILINVTSFFREPETWQVMAELAIARIAARTDGEPIRVWSAGCASGEEPYSLAILLAEAVGEDRFRRNVKVYATDVDEEALKQARLASYSARVVENIPPPLREKYFDLMPDGLYVFKPDLRRSVIFGRHDLMQDAPISRLDLLVCRNTLMYFNAETQNRILAQFHFALRNTGFLFLGKAEMLLTYANLFSPIDLNSRLFRKAPRPDGLRFVVPAAAEERNHATDATEQSALGELAVQAAEDATMIVDREGYLEVANEQARATFGLDARDIGRPFRDLEVSYRPLELRSLIEQAYTTRRPTVVADVRHSTPDVEPRYLDVRIAPLIDKIGRPLGASVTFRDIKERYRIESEIQRINQERETAFEELETTNEELHSTIEELQTTNEELQSTNEEMETMNEELHSMNEEMGARNDSLRQHETELNRLNEFLKSILSSLRDGVAVVDQDLNVLLWNDRAAELWGLRSDEVIGRSLLDLDIGLPVRDLREPVRMALSNPEAPTEATLQAVNRLGRAIRCRVSLSMRMDPDGTRQGVVLLMEQEEPSA